MENIPASWLVRFTNLSRYHPTKRSTWTKTASIGLRSIQPQTEFCVSVFNLATLQSGTSSLLNMPTMHRSQFVRIIGIFESPKSDVNPQSNTRGIGPLVGRTSGNHRSVMHDLVTGGNLPWFWVRMCGWSPRTPPHSYTRPSEKHDPFIYFPYRKLTPFIYYFWKLTPFIYYFSNFTHSYTFRVKKIPHWYTFWCKNDTHSYTGRPEKYTPFQPHICIYLYNGSYPPWI